MKTVYNRIAGESVERLAALSDGIFAVAMTLLVLDLHAPARAAVHSEQDLWRALAAMSPQLTTYLMSFLTLGIFWNGQQTQLNRFARTDRQLTWIHIVFLFSVSRRLAQRGLKLVDLLCADQERKISLLPGPIESPR